MVKELFPKFQRNIDRYVFKPEEKVSEIESIEIPMDINKDYYNIWKNIDLLNKKTIAQLADKFKIEWEQLCWFELYVKNLGQTVIEDYKIELEFEGDFIKVGTESAPVFTREVYRNNVKGYSNLNTSLYIKPFKRTLVSNDGFYTNSIYIKPKMNSDAKIKLSWKLLSRDFEDNGVLDLHIKPKYFIIEKTHFVSEYNNVKVVESISLIERHGYLNGLQMIEFQDKESDYTFK